MAVALLPIEQKETGQSIVDLMKAFKSSLTWNTVMNRRPVGTDFIEN